MDDKFKFQRKERELRRRSRPAAVEDAWSKIDRDDDLSVKEKLEKLINLTGAHKAKPAAKAPIEPFPREPIIFTDNPYPLSTRYGRTRLSEGLSIRGDILGYLSRNGAFSSLDLSTALFIDLETTGLAGGTGTVPFLIGMGYYRRDRFHIAQYFLGEMGEERRLIEDLGRFFRDMEFQSVVTYNGKAFDLPLLETRFILHRQPFALSDLPHLDLLFSARSLWKHKHESCRLFHLAQQIVSAERSEDIPSAEIPFRYFDYLRSGDFSLIEPILYHNQEDILSLLGLLIQAAKMFPETRDEEPEEIDAMDMFGVGKIYENAGDLERSLDFFERALAGDLPRELAGIIKKKLSVHFKRNADWERALSLWKNVSSVDDQLFCCRELSMYFEHKAKRIDDALKAAEEGLALALNGPQSYRRDFERRMERLGAKMRKRNTEAGPRRG